MITGVLHPAGWFNFPLELHHLPSSLSPQVPLLASSHRLLSAFIGRFRSYQAVPTFFLSPLSLLLCPLRVFFFRFGLVCCGPGKKKKEPDVMYCRGLCASSCRFLLVTFLSHRHLTLAALLPTRSSSSSSSEEPSSAAYSVAWSGPAPGDRFGSGDTIVGEWQVTPKNQKVVSPSFRLCAGGGEDAGCGAAIWPEVVEESEEGSYYVSLYVRCRFL